MVGRGSCWYTVTMMNLDRGAVSWPVVVGLLLLLLILLVVTGRLSL